MRAAIAILITGFLAFYSMATFEVEWWKSVYYLWDKGKDVLLCYALWQVSKKKYGDIAKPAFYFTLVRFGWEIISKATGIDINNCKWVGAFFILISIYVLYVSTKKNGRQ